MCKCIYSNCQFEDFFQDGLYYVKDNEKEETYCFFHAPEKLKEEFSYYQNKLFEKVILEYVIYCEEKSIIVDFSNIVFHIEFDLNSSELIKNNLSFNFSKTVFLKYFRMDNIKCDQLIFKDTEFYNGGGIKNKGDKTQVIITYLEFRPYRLDADFVIDIGKHATKDGFIGLNRGVIKYIKFENNKVGGGITHFIGFNEKLEEADFRNMILDKVSFQNCDLRKCYFLNAKVDETEFRNCQFNINQDYIGNSWITVALTFVVIASIYEVYDNGESLFSLLFYIFSLILLFTIFLNKHVSIYDENKLQKNEETVRSIAETYRLLRSNFGKKDYQKAGDFFYSQRLLQLSLKDKKYDKFLYSLHYIINGFGEKFLRPLIVFFLIIIIFSGFYKENIDFIATENTPSFLLMKQKNTTILLKNDINQTLFYKYQVYLDKNNTMHQRTYIPYKLLTCDTNRSKEVKQFPVPCALDRTLVKMTYSASQFISPFTSKNKAWFKTVSKKASIYNLIETILLYIFFGAFILALKNRIKR